MGLGLLKRILDDSPHQIEMVVGGGDEVQSRQSPLAPHEQQRPAAVNRIGGNIVGPL